MRFVLPLLLSLAVPTLAQTPGPCSFIVDTLSVTMNVRTLRGVYDLDWHSSSGTVRSERLWLWPTLPTDSSFTTPAIHPSPTDSLRFPLWGTITPRTTALVAEDSLRRSADPISPPVLMMTPFVQGDPPALLIGTVTTRRPNVLSFDGAGIGLWLTHADARGLAGEYRPYGIVITDSGVVCARRVR